MNRKTKTKTTKTTLTTRMKRLEDIDNNTIINTYRDNDERGELWEVWRRDY